MSNKLITVVTGANRGIGHAIVQTLASHTGPQPLIIYATSRSGASLDIKPTPPNELRFAQLDISSKNSISDLLALIQKQENTGPSILINNAGINLDQDYNISNAKKTFDVNYRGTRQVCELFLEEGGMKDREGARIVNVSSGASQLTNYSPEITTEFRSSNLTFSSIDALAASYLKAVENGAEKESGWNHIKASYSVSKACLNAATFVLARENPGVLINCLLSWVGEDGYGGAGWGWGEEAGGGCEDSL